MADSADKGLYDHEHRRRLLRFVAANPDLDELLGLWMADEDTFKLIHAEEAALFEREFRVAPLRGIKRRPPREQAACECCGSGGGSSVQHRFAVLEFAGDAVE